MNATKDKFNRLTLVQCYFRFVNAVYSFYSIKRLTNKYTDKQLDTHRKRHAKKQKLHRYNWLLPENNIIKSIIDRVEMILSL